MVMNWIQRDFNKMSVEELEFAKYCLERQINSISNTTENMEEINDLEIQFETVCQFLGLPL